MAIDVSSRDQIATRPHGLSTLPQVLRWRAANQPSELAFTFLVDGEDETLSLTYAELDREARSIAAALERTAARGSRALLVFDSGLDYIAALYGCLYAGVVAVPVYPPDPFRIDRTLPRLQSIVADAQAETLLATEATLSWAGSLFRTVPGLTSIVATDAITRSETARRAEPPISPEDLAILQYTSGSTGAPRGVVISHANLLANLRRIERALDREGVIAVSWLPAYHDMGLIGGIFQPVFSGRHTILMSPMSFMQRPLRWLKAVSNYRAWTTAGPNFAYDLCVRKIRGDERRSLDLSSLSLALNGAERVRADTMDRFVEAFGPCGFRREAFYPCYGLAEATLMVAGGPVGAAPVVRPFDAAQLEHNMIAPPVEGGRACGLVGCGKSVYGQQVVVADPASGQRLPERRVGEIWVSGPSIGRGYWNRPEESAATFGARLAGGDEGPFLRTGDLGFFDDGELFVTGRVKDMIVVWGRNLYPQDIEQTVLHCHEALKPDGGAAFSIDVGGEERLAIVQEVLRPKRIDPAALVETIRRRVAEEHGVPVYAVALILAGTLPKTSSGKTRRSACRQRFLSGALNIVLQWQDGRIDRQAERPAPAQPRNETEAALAELWRQVLGLETVGIDECFFDHGGQSLLATQLLARIRDTFGVELPLPSLFESPTIAELAERIAQLRAGAAESPAPALVCARREGELPLSFAQQRLWFLEQIEQSPRYNVPASARLQGPLDLAALERSFDEIVRRHEALRTNFRAADGRPVQVVHAERRIPLALVDLAAALPDAALEARLAEAQRLAAEAAAAPFDLEHDSLVRAALYRLSDQDYLLALAAHHIVVDGWSMGVFLKELAACYENFAANWPRREGRAPSPGDTGGRAGRPRPAAHRAGAPDAPLPGRAGRPRPATHRAGAPDAPLPALPLEYADFALWQREWLASSAAEKQLAYWTERFADLPPALELAADRPRTADARFSGASEQRQLPAELRAELEQFSRREHATLFMTLLASFQALLSRYTGATDLCIGSPAAGRTRVELEPLIGFFVNTLPLRTDLSGDPNFRQLLGRVRETTLGALANQEVPLDKLIEVLRPNRELGQSPLFQAMFVFENVDWRETEAAGLSIGDVRIEHRAISSFDLTLVVEPQAAGLSATIVYNAELFERATIAEMLAAWRTLLVAAVAQPEAPIGKLPLWPPHEADSPVATLNRTERAFPSALAIHDLFVEQAAKHPDAIAIACGGERLTYRELDRRSNQLARYLRAMGVGPEVPAGLCFERSVEMLVALLGVLKAGGAYVPLDSNDAPERLELIVDDVQMPVILTTRAGAAKLPPHEAEEVLLDAEWASIARESDAPLEAQAGPECLAYVIYTSGSTGRPKGVEITHRSLVNHATELARRYGSAVGDRVLQIISIGFDAAGEEIFPALVSGATLVLPEPAAEPSGRRILDDCRRHQITVLHLPTVLWQQCLADWTPADDEIFDHLRVLLVGGEAPAVETLRRWRQMSGGRERFLHAYGLTEATITSTLFELAPGEKLNGYAGRLPIGRPIANTTAYVLDAQQQPVPIGAPGELYLGGVGLTRGYRRAAGRNGQRLIADPFASKPGSCLLRTGDRVRLRADGNLEFLGRVDRQIKLRGFRIEPAEIEAALAQHPAVREAAVICREDSPGAKRLVAYVVPDREKASDFKVQLSTTEVRRWLAEKLPEYMLPAAVATLDSLPLTSHHKLDAAALPAPDEARQFGRQAYAAPCTPVEQTLAEIWAKLLGVERVGVDDNFFELGGDSILSIQVIARARDAGLRFAPKQLFQHQTIAELAAVEGTCQTIDAEQGPVVGPAPLTPIQHWFLDPGPNNPGPSEAGPIDAAHFNQAVLLSVDEWVRCELVEQALQQLCLHHDALRLRFERDAATWTQSHAEQAAWPMTRFDLSPLSADEQAATMDAEIDRLQTRLNLAEGPLAVAGWFDFVEAASLPLSATRQGCSVDSRKRGRDAAPTGAGRTRRLLLAVHHLAVDAVSWRILLEDLSTLYAQLAAGQTPALPPKTTSFRAWSRRLSELAESEAVRQEAPYWLESARRRVEPLPRDMAGDKNLCSSSQQIAGALDAEETTALLETAPAAYRTEINDLLLAGLARTLAEWTGDARSLVDLESHGRLPLFDDVDLSRTVGWCTHYYPLCLSSVPGQTAGKVLVKTKEALHRVPQGGVGYGLLRYLNHGPMAAKLKALPQAELSFNYLGRLGGLLPTGGPFALASESSGKLRSPRAERRHLLEINAHILEGRLQVAWTYSDRTHRRETVARLADNYLTNLRWLIAHCCSDEAGGAAPEDFPLADLDHQGIDQVARLLDQLDN